MAENANSRQQTYKRVEKFVQNTNKVIMFVYVEEPGS